MCPQQCSSQATQPRPVANDIPPPNATGASEEIPKLDGLDAEERNTCMQLFDALDTGKGGRAQADYSNHSLSKDELRSIDPKGNYFKKLDVDGSGDVDKAEWARFLENLKIDRGAKALHGFFKFMEEKLADKLLPWPGWELDATQVCPFSGESVPFDARYPVQIAGSATELCCDEFGRKVAFKVATKGVECFTIRDGKNRALLGCYSQGAWCYGSRWDSEAATSGTVVQSVELLSSAEILALFGTLANAPRNTPTAEHRRLCFRAVLDDDVPALEALVRSPLGVRHHWALRSGVTLIQVARAAEGAAAKLVIASAGCTQAYVQRCRQLGVKRPNSGILKSIQDGLYIENRCWDLSRNYMSDVGVAAFCSVLQHCHKLQELVMSQSGLNNSAVNALCPVLSTLPDLQSVDVRDNNIGWKGGLLILKLIEERPTITNVLIEGNQLDGQVPLAAQLAHPDAQVDCPASIQILLALNKNRIAALGEAARALHKALDEYDTLENQLEAARRVMELDSLLRTAPDAFDAVQPRTLIPPAQHARFVEQMNQADSLTKHPDVASAEHTMMSIEARIVQQKDDDEDAAAEQKVTKWHKRDDRRRARLMQMIGAVAPNPLNPPAQFMSPVHKVCTKMDTAGEILETAAELARQRTPLDDPIKALEHWSTGRNALVLMNTLEEELRAASQDSAEGYTITTSTFSEGWVSSTDGAAVAELDPWLRATFGAPPDEAVGLSVTEREMVLAWFRGMASYRGDAQPGLLTVKELEKLEGCRVGGVHVFKGDGDGKGNYEECGEFWQKVGGDAEYNGYCTWQQFAAFVDLLKRNTPEVYAQVCQALEAHTEVQWRPVKLTIDKLNPGDRAVWLLSRVLHVQTELLPLHGSTLGLPRVVPASMEDIATGGSFQESQSMLVYLATQYGAGNGFVLYPAPADRGSAPKTKALIDQLLFFNETKLAPAVAGWVSPQVDQGLREDCNAQGMLSSPLGYLEELLSTQAMPFLAGSTVSLADLCVACTLATLELVQDTLGPWPQVCTWSQRTKEALNEMDGGMKHWNHVHGYFEGHKGMLAVHLAQTRITALQAHPAILGIRADMARISTELPASLVGRWVASESYDIEIAQLALVDAPERRFERITVEHSKLSGKVYRPGAAPGGSGRLIIADTGYWSLEMPNKGTCMNDMPTLILEVRRRVARREGVEWRNRLETDENAVAGGPPLSIVKIQLADAANGMWTIDGFMPALSTAVHEDLDSVFQVVDVDGDGAITQQELEGVLGGSRFTQTLDESGDGLITKEEFLQFGRKILNERGARAIAGYTKSMKKKCDPRKLRRVVWRKLSESIFVGLDKDRSGTIDRDEIRQFDKRGKFFNKLDADGSGGVVVEEFVNYVLNMENEKNAKAVEGFLSHVKQQCEARIDPSPDDLMSSMTVITRSDFKEQYKHGFDDITA